MSDTEGELRIKYEEDKTKITRIEEEGTVSKRRLAGIMGVATSAMMVLLIVTFSLGMVGAALGVGIGGFVANFEEVKTSGNASIYPVLGEQAACENAPQLEANLGGQANITSGGDNDAPAVEFFKDLPLPGVFTGPNGKDEFARITIAGNGTEENPIAANGLTLRLTALEAGVLALGDQADVNFSGDGPRRASIAEFNSAGDSPADAYAYNETAGNMSKQSEISPSDTIADMSDETEFGIDAQGFQISQGTAAAHQVAFDGINLRDVNLAVQILNGSNQNAVVDPATPDGNSCDALANYAELTEQPENLGEDTDLTESSGGIQLSEGTNQTEGPGSSPRSNEFSGVP